MLGGLFDFKEEVLSQDITEEMVVNYHKRELKISGVRSSQNGRPPSTSLPIKSISACPCLPPLHAPWLPQSFLSWAAANIMPSYHKLPLSGTQATIYGENESVLQGGILALYPLPNVSGYRNITLWRTWFTGYTPCHGVYSFVSQLL